MKQESIGEFLREKGVITDEEVGVILNHSKQTGLRFCEAGLEIRILTLDKIVRAFAPGFKGDFFNVNASYMPRELNPLLTVEDIVKYGVLPLGYRKESRILSPSRRKILNVGLLDPSKHPTVVDTIQSRNEWKRRKKPFHSTNVYLVLIDQFLEVLEKVYGVTEEQLRQMNMAEVHPILARFLKGVASEEVETTAKLRLAA